MGAVTVARSQHPPQVSPCWPTEPFAFPQEACLQGNLIAICLEQLSDPHPLLRQWVAICLGRIWQNFDSARWCGVRDSAHEKLCSLLSDPIPEVSLSPASGSRLRAVIAGGHSGHC